MSFSTLFKKASNLLGFSSEDDSLNPPPLDGEIIFCKNNVCVHPPAALSSQTEHHPGYLNIRSQDDEVLGSTLILTWIPNSTLQKNPRSLESSPARPKVSPRRSPRQEYAKSNSGSPSQSPQDSLASDLGEGPQQAGDSHDRVSLSSSDGSDAGGHAAGKSAGELSESYKSQTDSGILSGSLQSQSDSDSISRSANGVRNNARDIADKPKVKDVGKNVNPLHNKHTNVKQMNVDEDGQMGDEGSVSSDSDSPTTDAQLQLLLSKNKVKLPAMEQVREGARAFRKRSSSSRSVTSIEMDGDNLVVVTEEIDDATFMDDAASAGAERHGGDAVDAEVSHAVPEGHLRRDSGLDTSGDSMSVSESSDSTYPSPTGEHYHKILQELQEKSSQQSVNKPAAAMDVTISEPPVADKDLSKCNSSSSTKSIEQLKESLDLTLNLGNLASDSNVNQCVRTPDIEITRSPARSDGSGSTSGPDSTPPSPITPPQYFSSPQSVVSEGDEDRTLMESPGNGFSTHHNFTFPENSISFSQSPGGTQKTAKEQLCGVFSVDLGQMRSLRIFYTNTSCTSGQLVIASRESQYKILHFHHGGLDRLASVFCDWKFLAQPRDRRTTKQTNWSKNDVDTHCKHFSVIRPHLSNDQCHPEEGAYEMVNIETWQQHMNEQGQIEDDFHLRKAIFFAGLESSVRHEMFPFLLHYYPYNSTYEQREQIRNDKYIEYQNIRKQRDSMGEEERESFWRNTQCTVEKDVVRTDRSHPYFKGQDNPNIEILKNILLNYAVAHPMYGYTQGMSDLLAPVLAEVQKEVDAYWCFVGLMQNTIFFSSPKDIDMDNQLTYLRELLRLTLPRFYEHLKKVQDGMELLFCHRWILLCFKREFPEAETLRMWETCWAHYQTDYFHLFLCVALIAVYGEDVIQQDLPADEMLLHFSSLSMHMSGDVVLKKARGLLHQFRTFPKIPCTLEGLCTLCGPGMWDSGHVPTVQCVGNHPDDLCPYGGKTSVQK